MAKCNDCGRRFSETKNRIVDGEIVVFEHTLCQACQGLLREAKRRRAIEVERVQCSGHGKKKLRLIICGTVGITRRPPNREPFYDARALQNSRKLIQQGVAFAYIN